MSTNAGLEHDVRAAVVLDPRVADPAEVAITADGGTVTLRGTVGSFSQRRAVVNDARDVTGVNDVLDELEVTCSANRVATTRISGVSHCRS